MKAYLRIEQISGAPDNEYYRDSRVVTVFIVPNEDKAPINIPNIPLTGLDTLQTNQMWSFNICDYENQSIVVTVSETKPDFLQLARVNLPLCWFPIDKQVNESYPMRPIMLGIAPLVALIDVHISSNTSCQPFRCGFSSLLFEPGWRPPTNVNMNSTRTNPVTSKSSLTKTAKLLPGKRLLKLGENNNHPFPSNEHTCLIENQQSNDFSDGSVEMNLSSSSSDLGDGNDKYSGEYSSTDDDNDDNDDNEKQNEGNTTERPGYAYFSPGGNLFPVATFSIKPLASQKHEHKHRHYHRHHHHHGRHQSPSHHSPTQPPQQPQQQPLLLISQHQKHTSRQIPMPTNVEEPSTEIKRQIKSAKSMDATPTFDCGSNKTIMSALQIQQFKDTPVISSVTNLSKGKGGRPLPRRILSKERFSGISEDKKASLNRLYRQD